MSRLLEIRDLAVHFRGPPDGLVGHGDPIRAVDGVDLDLDAGRTLALVGESGSGKTTVGRAIVRVQDVARGSIELNGRDLIALTGRQLRDARRSFQLIFQDPLSSLNPRWTVGDIITEPLRIHRKGVGNHPARVTELLELVGLPGSASRRYPFEFSGGQRQRIGIARALAVEPDLIVCDEPVSALDVSIQAQIINLLKRVQRETGVAYLFISHDLAVVRHMADDLAVMYLGRIVEFAAASDVYSQPRHPYTAALMSAAPVPDADIERERDRVVLTGDIPSPSNPPSGCRFHTRCWLRSALDNPAPCTTSDPALIPVVAGSPHTAACHFSDQVPAMLPTRESHDTR
ncbi:MAG: ATP-binding cassette domain-containing protein [Ilumatobacteraceae bacterium]|nr:ATP-binding cassette domain-containing protein [Ilumatobacteraceae bacterium]